MASSFWKTLTCTDGEETKIIDPCEIDTRITNLEENFTSFVLLAMDNPAVHAKILEIVNEGLDDVATCDVPVEVTAPCSGL